MINFRELRQEEVSKLFGSISKSLKGHKFFPPSSDTFITFDLISKKEFVLSYLEVQKSILDDDLEDVTVPTVTVGNVTDFSLDYVQDAYDESVANHLFHESPKIDWASFNSVAVFIQQLEEAIHNKLVIMPYFRNNKIIVVPTINLIKNDSNPVLADLELELSFQPI